MAYSLPNGSTVDLASSYSAPVAITSITNANPAVVNAIAHGFTKGDIVQITSGWERLSNRSFVVGTVTADTFQLIGSQNDTTDTTLFPVGSSSGSAKTAETFTQISQITGVEFSGGEQAFLDVQFLSSATQVNIPTVKSAITMTLTVADDPAADFLETVQKYDQDLSINTLRMNLVNGDSILYPAIITFSPTPNVTINELMTNTMTMSVQNQPTRYTR